MLKLAGHRHVVIGFQGSGKTTYAAALWHLVDSREVPTALAKGRHNGDYRYLEKIASAWGQGWQVERTGRGTWQPVTINLRSEAVPDEIALSFVDMSGETFEQVFSSREFDVNVESMARGCEGLLLFVSADRVIDDVTIVDIGTRFSDEMPDEPEEDDDDEARAEPDEGGEIDSDEATDSSDEADAKKAEDSDARSDPRAAPPSDAPDVFKPERTPRQVQITDLLDAFADEPIDLKPARIAVVISAWDIVREGRTPDAWLAESMPLLHQYLETHDDVFETRIYGVSAQGGRLPKREKPEVDSDRSRLLDEKVASRRIRVVGHGAGAHDLTHPIAWLSGLER